MVHCTVHYTVYYTVHCMSAAPASSSPSKSVRGVSSFPAGVCLAPPSPLRGPVAGGETAEAAAAVVGRSHGLRSSSTRLVRF